MEFRYSKECIDYPAAVAEMEERVAAIRAGAAEDLAWFLEHPPLYTAGTSAKAPDLLNPRFPVYETGRGGELTYHGPGQRVIYFVVDLKKRQQCPDIKKYICDLEQCIIDALQALGVTGERRAGRVGIWVVTAEGEKKIAAIGVRVRHWVAYHGVAVNIAPDLSHFSGIVPCGLRDYGVTSLKDLGLDVSMEQFDAEMKVAIGRVFGASPDQSAAIGNCCSSI